MSILFKSILSKPSTKRFVLKPTIPLITRTMASQAMNNEDLTIDKLFSVKDFTAVVTGGATGIGLMITQGLVANGATVIITGRRKDALQNVVEKYSRGGKIIG
jgi:NADPH:quinone reductase-like Zn-dependent oxidoreductase